MCSFAGNGRQYKGKSLLNQAEFLVCVGTSLRVKIRQFWYVLAGLLLLPPAIFLNIRGFCESGYFSSYVSTPFN
jgi:hypothetical protein